MEDYGWVVPTQKCEQYTLVFLKIKSPKKKKKKKNTLLPRDEHGTPTNFFYNFFLYNFFYDFFFFSFFFLFFEGLHFQEIELNPTNWPTKWVLTPVQSFPEGEERVEIEESHVWLAPAVRVHALHILFVLDPPSGFPPLGAMRGLLELAQLHEHLHQISSISSISLKSQLKLV